MLAYTLIHNCERTKYQWGQIMEILSPGANVPPNLDCKLRMAIHRKKCGWLD